MVPGNPDTATHAYAKEDEKANAVIEKIKKEKEELGIEGEIVKMIGEPGHCIVQKAHESNADFIVTGCRGAGTLRRTFMGSVSDYVMHHSDIPVFVCRH
ncbi:hypothetical protein KUTeg_018017 [Tegillarca granosa]|uniref:UspA domain-containing protein n=1 Tax=Tegillarca granosa TaxID=220873 RepID=A0ABQ9EGM0_TEGGR|nr:hypothetical protein KUTeg_018017 [Tegillarca granosa]